MGLGAYVHTWEQQQLWVGIAAMLGRALLQKQVRSMGLVNDSAVSKAANLHVGSHCTLSLWGHDLTQRVTELVFKWQHDLSWVPHSELSHSLSVECLVYAVWHVASHCTAMGHSYAGLAELAAAVGSCVCCHCQGCTAVAILTRSGTEQL